MDSIKIKILDKEMDIEKARKLYLELQELFKEAPIYIPMPYSAPYIDPWKPYPITYDKTAPLFYDSLPTTNEV